jgi:peptidoglycan/LPS O-acetylase OafA/YrhL
MLQSISTISDKQRISSVDIFRATAIIAVVLFHFNHLLPYGYIGVDLFFVISGLLVSALLVKDYSNGRRINFFKFILQRGFKIWPSYYVFLVLGNLIAYYFFRQYGPDQYIEAWDFKRYLFFYQNYTGAPFHLDFDGVWSLCVEEHFYILLPLGLISLQIFRGDKNLLFVSVILVILLGLIFKICSLYLTHSKDTSFGTHNRIDNLAWGVLLHLLIVYYPQLFKKGGSLWIFILGLGLLTGAILAEIYSTSVLYHKVFFHTLTPIAFFLMLGGLYRYDFSNFKFFRFIAYYSYNWYLWHPIIRVPVEHLLGYTAKGLAVYMVASFLVAMLFTIMVEEPVLKQRSRVINKIFKKQKRSSLVLAGSS